VKKIILYSLAVLLLAFGIWGYKLVWGKPFNIDHFFDRYLIGTVIAEPEILTLLGAVDNTILDFHSHKLTDASPQHTYKGLERNRKYLETLNSYNRERLSGQKAITYDMVEWLLESNAEGGRWAFHDFPVNQTFGIQSRLPDFMTTNHQIINQKSAENYIKRLRAFESKFDQVRESVSYRAERGVIPPRFVIAHVLREMNEFMNQPAEENPLYENTGMPMGNVVSEIERYIVMPGQALAYKVGMLHIQNLRTEAESRLGNSFDVAEFHDMILMNGGLPLEVLSGVAESWTSENSN